MITLTSLLSLTALSLIFVHYVWTKFQRKRKLADLQPRCTVPAGPQGHWLLGHSSLPPEQLAPTIASWSKTHGPIMEVFIIPKLFPLGIVINDAELVKGKRESNRAIPRLNYSVLQSFLFAFPNSKEMCLSRDLAHRDDADTPLRRVFNPTSEGILSQMWTPVWKDLRKFTMAALSQLGFGKAAMETQIVEEADELVEAILMTDGRPFEPQK